MTMLDDGRPVFVETIDERIGTGPWARLLATSVVPDEGSSRAERGRVLARSGYVHAVSVTEGTIAARVIGSGPSEYDATLKARPVPPRIWDAVRRSVRGIEAASAGLEQSVRLEHELTVGWGEPLVPATGSVRRSCTCPDVERSGTCKHLAALAYVVADAIDRNPSLLLEWRGCTTEALEADAAPDSAPPAAPPASRWEVGELPPELASRALPVAAVLKRLGPSGLSVDGADLTEILEAAYAAFAEGELSVEPSRV